MCSSDLWARRYRNLRRSAQTLASRLHPDRRPGRSRTAHARALGYDGKWAIHPSQLDTLNATFSPTPEEVERALGIVAALEQAESEADGGRGAVMLGGEMIDEALRKQALQVVARARAAGLPNVPAPVTSG